jgi:enoyl-CoA hydratase/carnithine racemase
VKEVVAPEDLLATAVAYAEDLARNCSPASMAVIKGQLYGDANDAVTDVSARAETLMHESLVRPDLVEGIGAFLAKRPPNFPPLKG